MYRNYIWFHGICQLKLRKNYGKTAKIRVFTLKIQLPSKQWVVGSIPARGAISCFFPVAVSRNKSSRFGFDDICTCIYVFPGVFDLAAALKY